MLDVRHLTFLTLCQNGSYTKAAEALHITQPAVSQHIKYLEQVYGGKLFHYENKRLSKTRKGEELFRHVLTIWADSETIKEQLCAMNETKQHVTFGVTLSIGEYIMPHILATLLQDDPYLHVTMPVENTATLLHKLHTREIEFAIIEGYFSKADYTWGLFAEEPYVAVCASNNRLAHQPVAFDDLLAERLIVREQGSGTREILTHIIREQHCTLASFRSVAEIGNMGTIKQLVMQDAGITFCYRAAVSKELAEQKLCEITIPSCSSLHAFHFVCLKNSVNVKAHKEWCSRFRALLSSKQRT